MRYLTISEYSKAFKISRMTIYKRIRAGLLHTIQTDGGLNIILVEDTELQKVKADK